MYPTSCPSENSPRFCASRGPSRSSRRCRQKRARWSRRRYARNPRKIILVFAPYQTGGRSAPSHLKHTGLTAGRQCSRPGGGPGCWDDGSVGERPGEVNDLDQRAGDTVACRAAGLCAQLWLLREMGGGGGTWGCRARGQNVSINRPRHYRPRRGAAIVSGTIVGIALLIRRPAAIAAVWGSRETLAAAEAVGARWPRAGLVLLDISEGWRPPRPGGCCRGN